MDPAAGVEGEVLCAGHSGDRNEVAGDYASGTTPPLEEAATGRLEGTAHEALAGQCAKGPNQLRVPRGDRPREPRRLKTAGLSGAVGTSPGGRVTATRKIAQHHRLAVTRASIVGANPIWSRTKPWKLLRLWRRRGAWASHRQ
jgi:hypothetical protein